MSSSLLQQPLLEKSNLRRESRLWQFDKPIRSSNFDFQKRISTRTTRVNNQQVFIYGTDKSSSIPAHDNDLLEFSNLSFREPGDKEIRGTRHNIQNQQTIIEVIKQETQELLHQNSNENISQRQHLIPGLSMYTSTRSVVLARNKEAHKQHLRKLQSAKKKKELTLKQKIDKFFGEGINSLILTLSDPIIRILSVNIPLDIIARGILTYVSIGFLLRNDSTSAYYYKYIAPLVAMLFARIVYVMTLVKMNFAEKPSVCVVYQKAFDHRSYFQIQHDRLFRQHYNTTNILKTLRRAFIPPQFCLFFINKDVPKVKTYLLMNMIFKGIEIMAVLPMFVVTISLGERLNSFWEIVCVSYMLEEAVRYVLSYLIINTMSK